jgi:hypothetical protein
MTDAPSSDELFATWRNLVEAGADAWKKAVQQAASDGQAPPTPLDPTQFWQQFANQASPPWAQFQGAGPVNPDMLKQWKTLLDDWNASWSKTLEQVMSTPAFAEALGKTLDRFLAVQSKAKQTAATSSKATLDALGLPSRDQIVELSDQLMNLEDRLRSLEDRIEAGAAPRPAATRGTTRKATKKTATRRTGARSSKQAARKTAAKRAKPKK